MRFDQKGGGANQYAYRQPAGMPEAETLHLAATETAPGIGRVQTGSVLRLWRVEARAVEDAVLITSELISKAVTPLAGDSILTTLSLTLRPIPVGLTVEVSHWHPQGSVPWLAKGPGKDLALLVISSVSADWGARTLRQNGQNIGAFAWALVRCHAMWHNQQPTSG